MPVSVRSRCHEQSPSQRAVGAKQRPPNVYTRQIIGEFPTLPSVFLRLSGFQTPH